MPDKFNVEDMARVVFSARSTEDGICPFTGKCEWDASSWLATTAQGKNKDASEDEVKRAIQLCGTLNIKIQ